VALTLRPRPGLMSAASTRRLLLARRFAETLVYAGAGSAALGLAGLPAGWLSGAIVGVSAAALSGRPMFVPPQVGRAVYVILGISLGSSVTPETVATMVTWPLSMLALTVAMVGIRHAATMNGTRDYTALIGAIMLAIALFFVWRSFYGMRIPREPELEVGDRPTVAKTHRAHG